MDVPNLLIVTPAYDGRFPLQYVRALLGTIGELQAHNVQVSWMTKVGDSLLPMARNMLAAEALADPGWTHMLLVDADIEWRPKDVLGLLGRDLPFVAGLYACKVADPALEYVPLPGKRPHPKTGLLEVDCVGAGFMLLKRQVLLRLIEAYPKSRITRTEGAYVAEHGPLPWLHDFFPLGFRHGVYESEDFAFCRRWRAIGGQIWADLNVQLAHHGNHAYAVDPMRLLKQMSEVA